MRPATRLILFMSMVLALGCLALGSDSQTTAEPEAAGPETAGVPAALPDCAGGLVLDDGDPETGYGFVPSASEGIYVQEFHAGDLPARELAKVCVCWLKTRGDNDAQFDVVFYEDAGGRPAEQPFRKVPGKATDIPTSKETAGKLYEVDVSGVTLPPGTSYVGVRWNPSLEKFLFVCTDTSEGTEKVEAFFREDRARAWASVFSARDPIFRPHRAILVRLEAAGKADKKSPPSGD